MVIHYLKKKKEIPIVEKERLAPSEEIAEIMEERAQKEERETQDLLSRASFEIILDLVIRPQIPELHSEELRRQLLFHHNQAREE